MEISLGLWEIFLLSWKKNTHLEKDLGAHLYYLTFLLREENVFTVKVL